MQFNSIDFSIFLPSVFFLYWLALNRSIKLQNLLLVTASYIFYGWWDWRFLTLIVLSTIIDYSAGIGLLYFKKNNIRKYFLFLSIIFNLSILGFFKYYNFFIGNFNKTFSIFGLNFSIASLNIVLPVGISFYTFQTMSYTIDVYRRKFAPTKDLVAFSAFVSFFPQLVAGPIERANNLLPQFYSKRTFDYFSATDGLRQLLWGLFKKIVIADNCAVYANIIFNNSINFSGSDLLLGTLFFAFQIYGDFSGYSDIAIGTARLFGFELMRNFAFPYFSRDIAEFWRRWHISLSTWFRDYVYIPLGGSRVKTLLRARNVLIIFIVCGFWHGANWTFVFWGLLNAIYFFPLLILNKNRKNITVVANGHFFPSITDFVKILTTFLLVSLSWIFFRAESIGQAFIILSKILSTSLFSLPSFDGRRHALLIIFYIFSFMLIEWIGRKHQYAISIIKNVHKKKIRWACYISIILAIYLLGNFSSPVEFIYFQF